MHQVIELHAFRGTRPTSNDASASADVATLRASLKSPGQWGVSSPGQNPECRILEGIVKVSAEESPAQAAHDNIFCLHLYTVSEITPFSLALMSFPLALPLLRMIWRRSDWTSRTQSGINLGEITSSRRPRLQKLPIDGCKRSDRAAERTFEEHAAGSSKVRNTPKLEPEEDCARAGGKRKNLQNSAALGRHLNLTTGCA